MTYLSPTTGERVGLSHIQPRSVDDLVRRRNMVKTWAEWSAGMFGRSPDFLNTMVMGCAANADYFAAERSRLRPKYPALLRDGPRTGPVPDPHAGRARRSIGAASGRAGRRRGRAAGGGRDGRRA